MDDRRLASGIRYRSAFPWREIRVPIDGPVGDPAVYKDGIDCGKRIRPRQHRPSGRTCHLAIYGSALSAKPLPTSCTTGPIALRFVTSGVSLLPQRTKYILYDLAIIVNPSQRLRWYLIAPQPHHPSTGPSPTGPPSGFSVAFYLRQLLSLGNVLCAAMRKHRKRDPRAFLLSLPCCQPVPPLMFRPITQPLA